MASCAAARAWLHLDRCSSSWLLHYSRAVGRRKSRWAGCMSCSAPLCTLSRPPMADLKNIKSRRGALDAHFRQPSRLPPTWQSTSPCCSHGFFCSAGEMARDFGGLPRDVLCCIFRHVLGASEGAPARDTDADPAKGFSGVHDARFVPFEYVYSHWNSLRLCCRHWKTVLDSWKPSLSVHISTAPPRMLRSWLAKWPVRGVLVGPPAPPPRPRPFEGKRFKLKGQGKALDGPAAGAMAQRAAQYAVKGQWAASCEMLETGPALVERVLSLANSLEHVQTLSIAAWPELRHSTLEVDFALLSHVRGLKLQGFKSYAFPSPASADSLAALCLEYCGSQSLQFLELPRAPRLERLCVITEGTLSCSLKDLSTSAAHLRLVCSELIAPLETHDEALVARFERPYREGDFLPPHIWGNAEAEEASAHAALASARAWVARLARGTARAEAEATRGAQEGMDVDHAGEEGLDASQEAMEAERGPAAEFAGSSTRPEDGLEGSNAALCSHPMLPLTCADWSDDEGAGAWEGESPHLQPDAPPPCVPRLRHLQIVRPGTAVRVPASVRIFPAAARSAVGAAAWLFDTVGAERVHMLPGFQSADLCAALREAGDEAGLADAHVGGGEYNGGTFLDLVPRCSLLALAGEARGGQAPEGGLRGGEAPGGGAQAEPRLGRKRPREPWEGSSTGGEALAL